MQEQEKRDEGMREDETLGTLKALPFPNVSPPFCSIFPKRTTTCVCAQDMRVFSFFFASNERIIALMHF